MGIRTVMISGDNAEVAKAVAIRLGIDEFHAQLMPADKIAIVKRYQDAGQFTAMVGDGINDAPALAPGRHWHRDRLRHRCRDGDR